MPNLSQVICLILYIGFIFSLFLLISNSSFIIPYFVHYFLEFWKLHRIHRHYYLSNIIMSAMSWRGYKYLYWAFQIVYERRQFSDIRNNSLIFCMLNLWSMYHRIKHATRWKKWKERSNSKLVSSCSISWKSFPIFSILIFNIVHTSV